VRDADRGALRDHRAEDPIAGGEGFLGERRLLARQLADPEPVPALVEPEQHRGVDPEALADEPEREEYAEFDLLDARAQEPLLIERAGARRRLLHVLDRRPEQPVAP